MNLMLLRSYVTYYKQMLIQKIYRTRVAQADTQIYRAVFYPELGPFLRGRGVGVSHMFYMITMKS